MQDPAVIVVIGILAAFVVLVVAAKISSDRVEKENKKKQSFSHSDQASKR